MQNLPYKYFSFSSKLRIQTNKNCYLEPQYHFILLFSPFAGFILTIHTYRKVCVHFDSVMKSGTGLFSSLEIL